MSNCSLILGNLELFLMNNIIIPRLDKLLTQGQRIFIVRVRVSMVSIARDEVYLAGEFEFDTEEAKSCVVMRHQLYARCILIFVLSKEKC